MSQPKVATERLLKGLALLCLCLWLIEAIALLRLPGRPFAGFRYEATLDVSSMSDPSWNGASAKIIHAPSTWQTADLELQQYDRIVSVDGHQMRRPEDLDRYVASVPVGMPIHYLFSRAGKVFGAVIPTERMSLGSWFRSYMSLMLPALLFLLVGMAAYWAKPDHPATGPHLLMTCAVALVGIGNDDLDSARLFLPLFPLTVTLLPSAMIHLGLCFPKPPASRLQRRLFTWLPYLAVPAISIPWAFFFRPEASWVNPKRFEAHMAFYNLAQAWAMVGFVALLGIIGFKAWRDREPSSRRQARIALLGAAVGFVPSLLLWGVPYFFLHGVEVGPLGLAVTVCYFSSVAFPISIVYDVLRAELFDIQVVIKRTVTYTLALGALAGIYFLLAAALRTWADRFWGASAATGSWENIAATAAVALAFNPLVTFTRARVDRIFDREAYDTAEILERFNRLTESALEPADLYQCYLDLAEQTVRPQHISIFVRDPQSGLLLYRAGQGNEAFGPGAAMTSDAGEIRELARAGRSGLLARKARTTQLSGSRRLWGFKFFAPLVSQGTVIGRVNLGPKRSDLEYSEQDQRLLMAMAHRLTDKLRLAEMVQVAVAKARLDHELATARNIQAAMLPAQVPEVRGIELACASRSANEFGGDFYDLMALDGGKLAVAVGDVAGKGVQAAMVMAMTQASFYTHVRQDPAIEPLMSGLNAMICDAIPDKTHRKTTFCYSLIDRAAGTATYSCAGHPPPLVFRAATRSCDRLVAPGAFPLGTTRRTPYSQQTVALQQGDALVFFTDGITEARNALGQAFYDYLPDTSGTIRECDELADVVSRYGLQPARTLKDAILARLAAFLGTAAQADDVTLVVLKIS